jgi:hypothetical protein
MPTRPSPGGSTGTWATELNAWLDVAHNSDGTIGAGQPGATAATRFVGATTSGAPVSGTFVAGDFVLDKTGAVWVCITAGTPGTWTCATKSRTQLGATAAGILTENYCSFLGNAPAAPNSGVVFGQLFGLRAGDSVTGIVLRNTVAAAGTLPTTARFGLADSTGRILVLSGNLNTLANWTVGPMLFPFTAPYTVLADGGYFGCFVVSGTWGTTQPTVARFGSPAAALSSAIGGSAPVAFQWTGQTDLPAIAASLTLTTGIGIGFYMALY